MQKSSSIAEIMSQRRKALGLTQAELALYSGCSRLLVSEIENGKTTIQMNKLMNIAETLGLTMKLEPKQNA
jgi:HTH-type transcriptional regulator / antitoxin HipB